MTQTDARTELQAVVDDLRSEGDELHALLKDMDTGYWTQHSSFKNWTVWDVVAHLHFSDYLAMTSLQGEEGFRARLREIGKAGSADAFTAQWLSGADGHSLTGPELLKRWRSTFVDMCDALAAADPDERFAWVGPGMKARMFATARQMETWAHGWEVYDLMGVPRQHSDRIRNIVAIGVRTYGWTFTNRKLEVPQPAPYVHLQAPSGEWWSFNEPSTTQRVEGDAVAFCQVVTQVRNVADTALSVTGDNAEAWMEIAQCFAGPPETPPAPGTRTVQPT